MTALMHRAVRSGATMSIRYLRWIRIFAQCALAVLSAWALSSPSAAQSLAVTPVNVALSPGAYATALTVSNRGEQVVAIQIRAYAWDQAGGTDGLAASRDIVASPPLATIAPGASQIIRLILHQAPQDRETTYRLLLDQIPPPAEPGIVHIVLRLSIPVFAQPPRHVRPDVHFYMEKKAGELYLVCTNEGQRHETIRDLVLTTSRGDRLDIEPGTSPYILAGSTRRWHVITSVASWSNESMLQLKAHADAGSIEEQVRVLATP